MGESERPRASPAFEPRFEGVLELMRRLRQSEGCPWHSEHTPRSILRYLIEEDLEVRHAILVGDDHGAMDELGDLLRHVAFQIVIAEEESLCDLDAVAGGLIAKIVRR